MSENLPFVGPQPFGPAKILYGRDLEISELRYYLSSKRIVMLSSPSGAGKSSLLNAKNGLLAKLRESQRFDVWNVARVNQTATGNGNRFSQSLLQSWEPSPPKASLKEYVSLRPRSRSPLIVIDQFEEILRLDPSGAAAKHAFFDELGELLEDPGVWALFVIREDYLAALTPYLRQLPTRLNYRYRIDFLRRHDQAVEAFTQPLNETGRHFAPGVVDAVLRDLALVRGEPEPANYVEPLQLQVVGQNLWRKIEKEPAERLIQAADIGAVSNALGRYYDDHVERKDADAERQLRNWVGSQLVNPAGYRNLVRQEASETGGLAQTEIDALCDAYLVRRELRAGGTWLELAHDRLVDPVKASNAAWESTKLSLLQRAADLWQENRRQEGFLISGAALEEAEQEKRDRQARNMAVTPVEIDFLEAAVAHRRRQRWKRAAVAGLVLLLLASVTVGWFAWRQKSLAEAATAEVARGLSRLQIQKTARLAYDHEAASALAYLAAALRPGVVSPEAEFWTGALLQRVPVRIPFEEVTLFPDPIMAVAVSADGKLVAAANRPGDVKVWSVAERREVGKSFRSQWGARKLSFHPDGERLLVMPASQEDFGAHVWSWRSGEKLFSTSDALQSAEFSGDGLSIETLSLSGLEAQRERFSAQTGKPLGMWTTLSSRAALLARQGEEFASPFAVLFLRGEPLVAGGGDLAAHADGGRIYLSRLAPVAAQAQDFGAPIDAVTFTPAGDLLIATSQGVWRQKAGSTKREAILAQRPPGRSLGFSPGGQWLIEPERFWNVATGQAIDLPPGLRGGQRRSTSRLGFNPAGDRVAGATGGSVAMWSLTSGRPEKIWQKQGAFTSAVISPAGDQVLVWGARSLDGPTRPELWKASDGQKVRGLFANLSLYEDQEYLGAFAANGGSIALGSQADSNIEVYDAKSGLQIGKPIPHGAKVRALAFGRALLVLTADGRVQSWDAGTQTPGGATWATKDTDGLTLRSGDRQVAVKGKTLTLLPVTPEIAGPEDADAVARLAEAVCGCELRDDVIMALSWPDRQQRLKEAGAARSGSIRALVESFAAQMR